MIRILLFLALSYCFNGLVYQESKIDFTFDMDPTSRYYWDFFYIVLPLTALLYARIAKWIFTFNRKTKEPKMKRPPTALKQQLREEEVASAS